MYTCSLDWVQWIEFWQISESSLSFLSYIKYIIHVHHYHVWLQTSLQHRVDEPKPKYLRQCWKTGAMIFLWWWFCWLIMIDYVHVVPYLQCDLGLNSLGDSGICVSIHLACHAPLHAPTYPAIALLECYTHTQIIVATILLLKCLGVTFCRLPDKCSTGRPIKKWKRR